MLVDLSYKACLLEALALISTQRESMLQRCELESYCIVENVLSNPCLLPLSAALRCTLCSSPSTRRPVPKPDKNSLSLAWSTLGPVPSSSLLIFQALHRGFSPLFFASAHEPCCSRHSASTLRELALRQRCGQLLAVGPMLLTVLGRLTQTSKSIITHLSPRQVACAEIKSASCCHLGKSVPSHIWWSYPYLSVHIYSLIWTSRFCCFAHSICLSIYRRTTLNRPGSLQTDLPHSSKRSDLLHAHRILLPCCLSCQNP